MARKSTDPKTPAPDGSHVVRDLPDGGPVYDAEDGPVPEGRPTAGAWTRGVASAPRQPSGARPTAPVAKGATTKNDTVGRGAGTPPPKTRRG
jgi:hypothetical protein